MKPYMRAIFGWVLVISVLGVALMFGPSHAKSQVTGVSVATLGSVDTFIAAVLQRLSILETQQASTSATQVQDEASMATWAAQISALTTRVQLLEAKAGTTPPVTNPPPTSGASADGSTCAVGVAGCQIVDNGGAVWTLASTVNVNNPVGNTILRNGGPVCTNAACQGDSSTAAGVLLLWFGGGIYTKTTSGSWWKWNGSNGFVNNLKDPRV